MAIQIRINTIFKFLVQNCDDEDDMNKLESKLERLQEEFAIEDENIFINMLGLQESLAVTLEECFDPKRLRELIFDTACREDGCGDLFRYLDLVKENEIDIDSGEEEGYALREAGCMATQMAARKGLLGNLRLLKEHGVEMRDDGESILSIAAMNGKLEVVSFLLNDCGADPRKLKETISYNNYAEVKRVFDDYIRDHY